MINELYLLFSANWAQLCAAFLFSIIVTGIAARYFNNRHFLRNIIVYFLVSEAFLGIVRDEILDYSWIYLVTHLKIFENPHMLYVFPFYGIIIDIVMIHVGALAFRTYAKKLDRENAMLDYMIYVVIGRLGQIISDRFPLAYLALYITFALLQLRFFRFQYNFMIKVARPLNWLDMIRNRIMAFFVFDLLNGILFFAFRNDDTIYNAMQGIIFFVCLIIYGYIMIFDREAIRVAQEHEAKISYMHQLETSQEDIIQRFSEIMETKSGETGMHVKRVSEFSAVIASELGIDQDKTQSIRIASMMHDIGKLLIPNEILEKPARLSDEEFEEMKKHTVYGKQLLENSSGLIIDIAREIASQHHERWDGTGYPSQLAGDEIALSAQIVAVADVYDALTSTRSYKSAWSAEDAQREIAAEEGTHFSPEVVSAFFKGLDRIEHIRNVYRDDLYAEH